MSNEVDGLVRVIIFYFFKEDLCSVNGRGGSGYACDKDIDAVMLEGGCDSTPVRYLEGCNGRADCDGIETQETMAKDDRMRGWNMGLGGRVRHRGEPRGKDALGLLALLNRSARMEMAEGVNR